jgi:hypothetical protein
VLSVNLNLLFVTATKSSSGGNPLSRLPATRSGSKCGPVRVGPLRFAFCKPPVCLPVCVRQGPVGDLFREFMF